MQFMTWYYQAIGSSNYSCRSGHEKKFSKWIPKCLNADQNPVRKRSELSEPSFHYGWILSTFLWSRDKIVIKGMEAIKNLLEKFLLWCFGIVMVSSALSSWINEKWYYLALLWSVGKNSENGSFFFARQCAYTQIVYYH